MENDSITTQFCRKCGVKIPGDSVFCPKCGEKVVAIPKVEKNCPASPEEDALLVQAPVSNDEPSIPSPKTEKSQEGKVKNLFNSFPIILIAIEIILQFFLVHTGIAMNNFYAIWVPLSLIPLLTPKTNPITGVYRPRDYNGDLFTPQHIEHTTRSLLTGKSLPDNFNIQGHDALLRECLAFTLIWVFLVIEIIIFSKSTKHSYKGKYSVYLVIPAISVNLWSELLYVLLGQVNAVVSYGFAFGLYLVVYYIVSKRAITARLAYLRQI